MSKHVKPTGLYALPLLMVGATLLGVRFYAVAESQPAGPSVAQPPGDPEASNQFPSLAAPASPFSGPLSIGPVPGLTTDWHPAPVRTSIPLGITLQVHQTAPADAEVTWTGAEEILRDESGSFAECPLDEVGRQIVRADVALPEGQRWANRIVLDVVDFPVDQIEVGPIEPSVEPVDLDEDSTNEETMYYFFNFASIAKLREVGEGQYRTSVERKVLMNVEVDPPGFAPLIEWRFDGETELFLGQSARHIFRDVGVHAVSAGPPANSQEIEVETYKVTITSHQSNEDIVPDGEPVRFEAVTDPPGYENEISWLSSTKYGTAAPVLGQGPTFTVQFDHTWGFDEAMGIWEWLGVRADDDMFNQDGKPGMEPFEEGGAGILCDVQSNCSDDFCTIFGGDACVLYQGDRDPNPICQCVTWCRIPATCTGPPCVPSAICSADGGECVEYWFPTNPDKTFCICFYPNGCPR